MTFQVRRFRHEDTDPIERLNRRLDDGQTDHRVYPEDLSLNPDEDLDLRPVNDALYVVADGDEIRGGAWLREQYFWVDGARQRVGWMKYPVSESLVDPAFAGVPASMVLQFLRRQPHLMALGMGGHDAPFARILRGIRWESSSIPLFLRVSRPMRFLRGVPYLRRRWPLRVAMNLAAWSGVGWLAHWVFYLNARRVASRSGATAVLEERFSPWADAIWDRCRDEYHAMAVRDAKTLDYSYPASFPDLHRLRVTKAGVDVGWVCVQTLVQYPGLTPYFGDLTVGVVTDGLAKPAEAHEVLALGVQHLEKLGVDLILTNLSHKAWMKAARRLGFLQAASTFAFYRSPKAQKLLTGGGDLSERCHMTRSDGDGPWRPA